MNESQRPTDLQEKGGKKPLTKAKTVIEMKKAIFPSIGGRLDAKKLPSFNN